MLFVYLEDLSSELEFPMSQKHMIKKSKENAEVAELKLSPIVALEPLKMKPVKESIARPRSAQKGNTRSNVTRSLFPSSKDENKKI